MAEDNLRAQAWAYFDAIVDEAAPGGTYSNPWTPDGTYTPHIEVLERLLGAVLLVVPDGATQSGVPALALDVWVAYELRRAGFDGDLVWPRTTAPRVVPPSIIKLFRSFKATNKAAAAEVDAIQTRLLSTKPPTGIVGASANILGKNYFKQVDVILSDWHTGPEILVSTKRMDSSFGNNAANRIEESYGDAKNLRGRHPLAALGFVFGVSSNILYTEPEKARWLFDLLEKLGKEDDAYDAVCLLLLDYTAAPPPDEEEPDAIEEANLPEFEDANEAPEEAPDTALTVDLTRLPTVSVIDTKTIPPNPEHVTPREMTFDVPTVLRAGPFMKTIVEHVLSVAPVSQHPEARTRRGWPHVEPVKKKRKPRPPKDAATGTV